MVLAVSPVEASVTLLAFMTIKLEPFLHFSFL